MSSIRSSREAYRWIFGLKRLLWSVLLQYLAKQVELLRQVNEQHARVYEQLDASARELEQSNRQLLLDKRTAQQKLQR